MAWTSLFYCMVSPNRMHTSHKICAQTGAKMALLLLKGGFGIDKRLLIFLNHTINGRKKGRKSPAFTQGKACAIVRYPHPGHRSQPKPQKFAFEV